MNAHRSKWMGIAVIADTVSCGGINLVVSGFRVGTRQSSGSLLAPGAGRKGAFGSHCDLVGVMCVIPFMVSHWIVVS